jgi:hypothetical protein
MNNILFCVSALSSGVLYYGNIRAILCLPSRCEDQHNPLHRMFSFCVRSNLSSTHFMNILCIMIWILCTVLSSRTALTTNHGRVLRRSSEEHSHDNVNNGCDTVWILSIRRYFKSVDVLVLSNTSLHIMLSSPTPYHIRTMALLMNFI